MNIEFSTTQNNKVEEYLNHADFDWLNDQQREYILKNIGDIRVQDPMMYSPARLAVHENGEKHLRSWDNLTYGLADAGVLDYPFGIN